MDWKTLAGAMSLSRIEQALDDDGDGIADESAWALVQSDAEERIQGCFGGAIPEQHTAAATAARKLFILETLFSRCGITEGNPLHQARKRRGNAPAQAGQWGSIKLGRLWRGIRGRAGKSGRNNGDDGMSEDYTNTSATAILDALSKLLTKGFVGSHKATLTVAADPAHALDILSATKQGACSIVLFYTDDTAAGEEDLEGDTFVECTIRAAVVQYPSMSPNAQKKCTHRAGPGRGAEDLYHQGGD